MASVCSETLGWGGIAKSAIKRVGFGWLGTMFWGTFMRVDCLVIVLLVAGCDIAVAETPAAPAASFSAQSVIGNSFAAHDTLAIGDEVDADARNCLQGLAYPPGDFVVTCEASKAWRYDALLRFPSVVATGDPINDRVTLEWHMARDEKGDIVTAPAVLVVHESGSSMPVGKTLATLLSRHGLHAFMIHLPGYGERRSEARPKSAASLIRLTRQSILDVRRARDAIAVMPMVDVNCISIQGTSLGGFIGSTAACLDDAFDGVFLMLCGGDLYQVLQTGQRDAANMRRKMAEEGLEGEALRQLLWTIEPLRVAHRLPPQRTWLFSGRYDDVVPLANAELLAKAAHLGPEHHILYDADHYSGVVRIPEMIDRMRTEMVVLAKSDGS